MFWEKTQPRLLTHEDHQLTLWPEHKVEEEDIYAWQIDFTVSP